MPPSVWNSRLERVLEVFPAAGRTGNYPHLLFDIGAGTYSNTANVLDNWEETLHDYLLSFLLGIIEGLTEFLPVSSTAHLRISEALLHIPLSDPYWKMYSIVIQLGAILCLPIYFRSRIAALHVHHRRRTSHGDVALRGIGVFFLSLHANHDRGYWI